MLAVYLLVIQFCFVIFQEWRNEEMALIDELYSGPERKAALVGLLEQEANLTLQDGRKKGTAKRLCETNVTAPFLMCLVVIFT